MGNVPAFDILSRHTASDASDTELEALEGGAFIGGPSGGKYGSPNLRTGGVGFGDAHTAGGGGGCGDALTAGAAAKYARILDTTSTGTNSRPGPLT